MRLFSFFATHKVRWYALQCVLMRLALCFEAPMDSDRFERMETHGVRRQDMCCTGTGKPVPIHHCHLFAFGSTYLALRGAQPLPRLRAKAQQQQERP